MGPRKKRWLAAVLTALALIAATTGVVYAYLSADSSPVNNTFEPDEDPAPTIVETLQNNVKTNVCVDVGNPGYAVYVRAAIVVTWEYVDENNVTHVYAQQPVVGKDYEIDLNTSDWFEKGGFYYHRAMVAYDGENAKTKQTAVLINSLTQSSTAPSDYTLHVEIIAQTIQALGTTDDDDRPAVTAAWGISVDTYGNLIP